MEEIGKHAGADLAGHRRRAPRSARYLVGWDTKLPKTSRESQTGCSPGIDLTAVA